ncbi:hypothetical protein PV328_007871 [Microctonus aethiopoides]|uniref:Uncharacterized protein n=1 Tax=Microctonus aethiopoides TaxID=144406 RepID=A0AA39C9S8_9HYME|nr:hypothetical protein PV328_007871 [Microctonus aethiopoides]
MSKQYYRLKKHRELQKKNLILQEKRDDNIVSIVDEVDSEQCEIKSDVSIDQSESSFEASVGILVNSNPSLNSENNDGKIIADSNQLDGEKSVSESSDNDIVGLENKLKHCYGPALFLVIGQDCQPVLDPSYHPTINHG